MSVTRLAADRVRLGLAELVDTGVVFHQDWPRPTSR